MSAMPASINSTNVRNVIMLVGNPQARGAQLRAFAMPLSESGAPALGERGDRCELPHAVDRARAAILVIHDSGDREVPRASGLALARAWPGARFSGTHGLGHDRILRNPEVVADAADFIARRVVFAPPPARGAAVFGAPAPIF